MARCKFEVTHLNLILKEDELLWKVESNTRLDLNRRRVLTTPWPHNATVSIYGINGVFINNIDHLRDHIKYAWSKPRMLFKGDRLEMILQTEAKQSLSRLDWTVMSLKILPAGEENDTK